MPVSRYTRTPVLDFGRQYGTSRTILIIRNAVKDGTLEVVEDYIRGGERLDHLAHEYYNDGAYWWIIAAASGIGWGMQLEEGTLLLVPVSLKAVLDIVG